MGAYSNDDVIERRVTNDYSWLQEGGGVQNGQKNDDVICERALSNSTAGKCAPMPVVKQTWHGRA